MNVLKKFDVREVRLSFNEFYNRNSLEALSRLTNTEAAEQLKFLDTLISDVICRQLLTEAVSGVAEKLGLEFEFRQDVDMDFSDEFRNGKPVRSIATMLLADVRHDGQLLGESLEIFFSKMELVRLRETGLTATSETHRRLLASIFQLYLIFGQGIDRGFGGHAMLKVYLGRPRAAFRMQSPADEDDDNYNTAAIRIPLCFKAAASIQDLIVRLITAGYDLSAVRPFLMLSDATDADTEQASSDGNEQVA